jgi:hypothetical protein
MPNPKPPVSPGVSRATLIAGLFLTWLVTLVTCWFLFVSRVPGFARVPMLVIEDDAGGSGRIFLSADSDLGPNMTFRGADGQSLLNLWASAKGGYSMVTFFRDGQPLIELGVPATKDGDPRIRFTDPKSGEKVVYPPGHPLEAIPVDPQ